MGATRSNVQILLHGADALAEFAVEGRVHEETGSTLVTVDVGPLHLCLSGEPDHVVELCRRLETAAREAAHEAAVIRARARLLAANAEVQHLLTADPASRAS